MKLRLHTLLLAGALAAGPAWAAEDTAARVEAAIAANPIKGAKVALCVRRLSDGAEIVGRRPRELLSIASNAKLVTTAAALWRLGADYQFQTRLVADGAIADGVLKGDLILIGGGDPGISGRATGDMFRVPALMAKAVNEAGIRVVEGDLVLDDRLFDRVHRAPTWPSEESLWWYAAPVSALSFNDNCADVSVTGAAKAGARAVVDAQPPFVRLINRCTTVPRGKSANISFNRDPSGAIIVDGTVEVARTRTESITVEEPALFLGQALCRELERAGVTLQGTARLVRDGEESGKTPSELFVWRSSLGEAIAIANQRSQNFYAEQIFKTMGATEGRPGSFESGAATVRAFCRAVRLPDGVVTLVDGCGLSLEDKATAQALAGVLEAMYRSKLRQPYFNSLAANAEPRSTLRHRLGEPWMAGRIHAKTGTIESRGISALSGYAEALDGEVYGFSILVNGASSLGRAYALQDDVCRALVQAPRKDNAKTHSDAKKEGPRP